LRQPVTVACRWWTRKAVIKRVQATSGADDGEQLKITIELQTVTQVKPDHTTIPKARIKPKKQRVATPKKPGGTGQGKQPTTDQGNKIKGTVTGIAATVFPNPSR